MRVQIMLLPNIKWSPVGFVLMWLFLLSWSEIYEKQLIPQDGWAAIANVVHDKAIYILALVGLGMDKLKIADKQSGDRN